MNACPCCARLLLRHIRQTGIYWFCGDCRQEMPNLTSSHGGKAHVGNGLIAVPPMPSRQALGINAIQPLNLCASASLPTAKAASPAA
ncbi:MAG: hypothetical protein ACFB4J_19230 [Elainellaceae cyanobacterium]